MRLRYQGDFNKSSFVPAFDGRLRPSQLTQTRWLRQGVGERRSRMRALLVVQRRFALDLTLPQSGQEYREVSCIEQGLTSELDSSQLATFDGRIQGCSTDAELLQHLANTVRCLCESECAGIDRRRLYQPAMID